MVTSKEIKDINVYNKRDSKISDFMISRENLTTAGEDLVLQDAFGILERENKG